MVYWIKRISPTSWQERTSWLISSVHAHTPDTGGALGLLRYAFALPLCGSAELHKQLSPMKSVSQGCQETPWDARQRLHLSHSIWPWSNRIPNETNWLGCCYHVSIIIKRSACPSICQFVAGITHQKIKLEMLKLAMSFRMIVRVPRPKKWKAWEYPGQGYLEAAPPPTHTLQWKLRIPVCGKQNTIVKNVMCLKTDHQPQDDDGSCRAKNEGNQNVLD